MEVFPNYYEKFKCLAGACKHSCCIGWEIDIDEETMALYHSLGGEMGEKIRSHIEGEVPHFILQEKERCPFLNQTGLCDIICELGDGAICDICYLHPRFSHFYSAFTETGLGLCCEEAVRIILTEEEKFSISIPTCARPEEKAFLKERQAVFDILQNREFSFLNRLQTLAKIFDLPFDFPNQELYEFYMSLERLDADWEAELKKLLCHEFSQGIFERQDLQLFFEQLGCYFVFRHFDKGVGFALLGCYAIGAICAGCTSFEKMLDVVRMYSSEIEYSEENTEKVANFYSARSAWGGKR